MNSAIINLIIDELDPDIRDAVNRNNENAMLAALLLQISRYQRYTATHTDRIPSSW